MSTINDGGRALNEPHAYNYGTMTLRDYFAGQALVGLSGQPAYATEDSAKLAEWSYQQADAMLAAREGKQ